MSILNYVSAINNSWNIFAEKLGAVAPHLFGAGLILVLGSLLAMGIGEGVGRVLEKLKLDELLEKTYVNKGLKTVGLDIKVSSVVVEFVKWVILFVIFVAAADVVNLPQLSQFFNEILHYLPNVFIAVIILVLATVLSTFVGNVISTAVKDEMGYYSGLAKGAIYTFAVLAALHQLQISPQLVEILFTGIVAALVLAFGLGGKEVAGEIVKKFYDDFKSQNKKK